MWLVKVFREPTHFLEPKGAFKTETPFYCELACSVKTINSLKVLEIYVNIKTNEINVKHLHLIERGFRWN